MNLVPGGVPANLGAGKVEYISFQDISMSGLLKRNMKLNVYRPDHLSIELALLKCVVSRDVHAGGVVLRNIRSRLAYPAVMAYTVLYQKISLDLLKDRGRNWGVAMDTT